MTTTQTPMTTTQTPMTTTQTPMTTTQTPTTTTQTPTTTTQIPTTTTQIPIKNNNPDINDFNSTKLTMKDYISEINQTLPVSEYEKTTNNDFSFNQKDIKMNQNENIYETISPTFDNLKITTPRNTDNMMTKLTDLVKTDEGVTTRELSDFPKLISDSFIGIIEDLNNKPENIPLFEYLKDVLTKDNRLVFISLIVLLFATIILIVR
jgi:hypothetical protein